MIKQSIEERVDRWYDYAPLPLTEICIHIDDAKAVLQSPRFREDAMDGKPMFLGLPFRILGVNKHLEYSDNELLELFLKALRGS